MTKHYIFFTRNTLPQPRADLVQVANCANAAANLGYSTVLTYLSKRKKTLNPINLISPFYPQFPDQELADFYNIQDKLKVAELPLSWPIGEFKKSRLYKLTNVSTVVCKYYLPIHLRPVTQIIHTRDWNFVKASIKCGIPAIYEHHHHEDKQFEIEIVSHPLFQLAVTVADTVRDGMIASGMPSEKVITLHNGFNQVFSIRKPQEAENWRQRLLENHYQSLAVYSGGLNQFKGVDLMIDAAQKLPQVHFVFAGGDESKVNYYRNLARSKQIQNTTFLGHLIHAQLASLLQASDVLVHPHSSSVEATFTSPLKFFDYMASGTPIVATEIAPLMDFKHSDVVAGWCEPDSSEKLAECIQRVLNTHPRKSDGYAASRDFVRQFSWEHRISKILSYVEPQYRPCLMS